MPQRLELAGKRFGRLVAIESCGCSERGKILWLCQCDCGRKKITVGSNLVNGHTQSCVCLQQDSARLANHVRPSPYLTMKEETLIKSYKEFSGKLERMKVAFAARNLTLPANQGEPDNE